MKKIAVLASLLMLVVASAQAMNFRTESNGTVSINKLAVLGVSNPELIKWRLAQDANPELANPKEKLNKPTGLLGTMMFGFGGAKKVQRAYQMHPDLESGKIPSYMQLVTQEEDKEVVETFKKSFKKLRVEGILLPDKAGSALLEANENYEYLLCTDFASERERGQAIYSRTGADGYVVGKILDINYNTRTPYVSVVFGCYDKEGTYVAGAKYTSSGPLLYFDVKDGLKRCARGFANELKKREKL